MITWAPSICFCCWPALACLELVCRMSAFERKSLSLEGANHRATGKAGITRVLAIEHYCSGLPEPGR
jgi:hypothetical protein